MEYPQKLLDRLNKGQTTYYISDFQDIESLLNWIDMVMTAEPKCTIIINEILNVNFSRKDYKFAIIHSKLEILKRHYKSVAIKNGILKGNTRKRSISDESINEIKHLCKKGHTQREVADMLGFSVGTINYYLNL